MKLRFCLFVGLSLVLQSCKDYSFDYKLSEPSARHKLPSKINEASGISVLNNEEMLLIDDEKGTIYTYNIKKEKLGKKYSFAKGRDYEGIEIVDSGVYILSSKGDLYFIDDLAHPKENLTVIKTFLTVKNNAEGLGYDPIENRLLIACKGNKKKSESRYIYEFDLASQELKEEALYEISYAKVARYVNTHSKDKKLSDILDRKRKKITYNPSGIAVHPTSREVYIISTLGHYLMVLDPNGDILHLEHLSEKKFKQPEGIAFMADGTMLIVNEGKDGKASILKFKVQSGTD